MFCKKKSLLAIAAAVALGTAGAAPVALTTDGAWFEFVVADVGDAWRSPLDGDPVTFTLTSASAFTLRVVDTGFAGDRVEVVLGGSSVLGTTADVAVDDTVFAFSPDDAFAEPAIWSQGVWALAAGTYSFSGTATASPFGGAGWAISALAVTTPPTPSIPEPGTWALVLASGLALTATTARRRGLAAQR